MKWIVRLLIFVFVLSLPSSYGCSRHAMSVRKEKQRRKELAKMQEQKEQEAQAGYEAALERHYSMQTKKTQKEMRQTIKKSNALRENKKPFFLKRWFTPKTRKKRPQPRGT